MGGNLNVAIGESMTGIAAVISESDPPTVTSVGLGNVDGITLAMGGGQGDATATKVGNTYTITGNASASTWPTRCSPRRSPSNSSSPARRQTPRASRRRLPHMGVAA